MAHICTEQRIYTTRRKKGQKRMKDGKTAQGGATQGTLEHERDCEEMQCDIYKDAPCCMCRHYRYIQCGIKPNARGSHRNCFCCKELTLCMEREKKRAKEATVCR